jgi:hypothetical protein
VEVVDEEGEVVLQAKDQPRIHQRKKGENESSVMMMTCLCRFVINYTIGIPSRH